MKRGRPITDRQFSIYTLIEEQGRSIRGAARSLGINPSAAHKAYHAAKDKIEGRSPITPVLGKGIKSYNPQGMDNSYSCGSAAKTAIHDYASPLSKELVFTDAGWDKVNWIGATYDLHDWRIDSPIECEICQEPMERCSEGRWCNRCGKWAYQYDVGSEDPELMKREW